jgi:protein-disulfide isomerase/uncharacterized membrane protein
MITDMKDSNAPNLSNPKIRLALVPLLSVIGASAGVYLSKHYYGLRSGTASFNSLCNIGSTMNCDAVTASQYSEIYPGLPLASFVAGWFLALIIIGVIARSIVYKKEAILAGAIMTGISSLFGIGLLVIMIAVVKKFCLFCLIVDAVSFSLFGIFLSLLPRESGGSIFGNIHWGRVRSLLMIAVGAVIVMIVILRPTGENDGHETSATELQYTVNRILESAPVVVNTPPEAAILGNPSAPITIHEFSDFQCPHCKRGAVIMNQVLARHEGKVRVIFMPFPLDSACNRLVTQSMHPFACELSRAAYCAEKSGKFRPVYEKIFEDQEVLTKDSASKIPADAGLSAETQKTCVASDEAKKFLSVSIEEGVRLGVQGTPTFFINGRKVDQLISLDAWDQIIAGIK